jgi:hypothetical protein
MGEALTVSAAVEGSIDEAVLRRLLHEAGIVAGTIYGKTGKSKLLLQLPAYNHAARFQPWVVLMDLDRDADCVPPFLNRLQIASMSPGLCFRVAVRATESWLLADRERFSSFFGITLSKVPQSPEELQDPKRFLAELARSSRRREIRQDVAPRPKSGRAVGPAYTSRLIEYIQNLETGWRPEIAAQNSESLARCLRRLQRLAMEPASREE